MPVVAPQTAADLPVFYLFWVLLYLTINIVWDVRTAQTPAFHLSHLGLKTPVAFNAASFASSLLILIGLVDKDVMKVAGDTLLPIMLAGLSGIFFGLSEICPYKPNRATIPSVRSP